MAKLKRTKKIRLLLEQQVHPNAGGIDVSATEMVVAVPPGSNSEPVRTFGTMSADLKALCRHLKAHGVTTVAMESTGLYWIALYDVLEAAGIEVVLVNARHVKNVPGRKSDVVDAQWLAQLHGAGLLRGGFRPPQSIRRLRDLLRERADYIEQSSHCVLMMQRCFDQMNVQLHRVLSDIDGESGRRIIEAILAGTRDGKALEKLRDVRCKKTKQEVIKALDGQWDDDCIARLGRAYALWGEVQKALRMIGERSAAVITGMESAVAPEVVAAAAAAERSMGRKPKRQQGKSEVMPGLQEEALRLYGVDLMAVPGISHSTVSILLSEVGTAAEIKKAFPASKQFTSWLGLCPDNRISGGRVLGCKTRQVAHRLAAALRLSAFSLWRSAEGLGDYCRRMKGRLGKAEGITATAHKIARIIYHMITTGCPYSEEQACRRSPAAIARKLENLKKQAQALGYQLLAA
jgi:transposase